MGGNIMRALPSQFVFQITKKILDETVIVMFHKLVRTKST